MEFYQVNAKSINKLKEADMATQATLFKRLKLRHKTTVQNVWFNLQCIKCKVTPKYIQIKTKSSTAAGKFALDKAKKIWLKQEIREGMRKRDNLLHYIKVLHAELSFKLHPIEFDSLDNSIRDEINHIIFLKFQKQCRKLTNLIENIKPNTDIDSKYNAKQLKFYQKTINLSSVKFSDEETNLLDKGFKYQIPQFPSARQLELLAVDTELALSRVEDNKLLKHTTAKIISNSVITTKRKPLNKEFTTLKNIKAKTITNNLIITKADKGNSIVILNKNDYIDKVNNFLKPSEFTKLAKDPTPKLAAQIKNIVKDCNIVFPTESMKRYVNLMNPTAPLLYGQPKIHKTGTPIRPVVSFTNTPTVKLAYLMNKIFKDKTKFKAHHSVENSIDLIDKIKNIQIPANSKFISLDVISLFSNIPVKECLEVMHEYLEKSKIHPFETEEIYSLIKVCTENNYFLFNSEYYQQNDGLPMGSPLSPLLAEIFMNNLETKLLELDHKNILYYYRYVDDILICWLGTERQLRNFLLKANLIHSKIKFTLEVEIDKSINFLDLTITRVDKNHNFKIFRKPTFCDTTIHAKSLHSWNHKLAAYNSMIHRLVSIPMNYSDYQNELKTIIHIAINNGYKATVIQNLLHKKQLKLSRELIYPNVRLENRFFKSINYLGRISEKIHNEIKHSVNVAFKVNNNLGMQLKNSKDKINNLDRSGIYKMSCGSCNAIYIGQTGRSISTRAKEHIRSFNNAKSDSQFANHFLTESHNMSLSLAPTVLHLCHKGQKLNILEQLEINRHRHNILNEQTIINPSPLLKPLM